MGTAQVTLVGVLCGGATDVTEVCSTGVFSPEVTLIT